MPSFKTHSFASLAVGAILCAIAWTRALIEPGDIAWFILLAGLGAMVPDIDSDTSTPFHLLSLLIGVACGGICFFYCRSISFDIKQTVIYTFAGFGAAAVILVPLLKLLTHHRGIWHTLPFALIPTLLFFIGFRQGLGMQLQHAWVACAGFLAGYLSHLLLDGCIGRLWASSLRMTLVIYAVLGGCAALVMVLKLWR